MRTAVIQNKSLLDSGRIDPSYHLSESIKLKKQLLGSPYTLSTIGEKTEDVFLGNIFTRVFVKDAEHGIPYIAASDMTKASIDSGKFISKNQAKKLKRLMLDSGWILISCSGTLGNVVYTNGLFKNTFATHDLIRLIPDDKKMPSGFLYAYLASKYGYTLLTQSGFGGVVKHINPDHVANIPIPLFPDSKQKEIHNLIVESANLRVDANRLLEKAQAILTDNLNYSRLSNKQWKSVPSNTIRNSFTSRFESSYYVNEGQKMASHIKNNCSYKLLKDITSDIFRPGIFKRIYVKEGIFFLGGSDIMQRIPSSEKQLSISKTKGLDSLMVKEGWILVTCGGTIGNSVYVDSEITKCAASQHILRLIPKDIPAGYLFAFINSNFGKKIIQRYTYGSVIPQIEPSHIGLIPVPLLDNTLIEHIDMMTIDSITKNEIAKKKELQAISLVEKEIESWQQS